MKVVLIILVIFFSIVDGGVLIPGVDKKFTATDFYGGDMLIPPEQRSSPLERGVACATCGRWPRNEHGLYEVPVKFESTYTAGQLAIIRYVMDYIEYVTNIQFITWKEAEKDYVYVYQDNGCFSQVGKAGGKQVMSLAAECLHVGIVIHEFMHAFGVGHEHQRKDQEDYLTLNVEAIDENMLDQLVPVNQLSDSTLYTEYDTASIMHYGRYAFVTSKNNFAFDLKNPDFIYNVDGQRAEMTSCDINIINQMYPGTKRAVKCHPNSTPGGFVPTVFSRIQFSDSLEGLYYACRYDNDYVLQVNEASHTIEGWCEPAGGGRFPPPPADLLVEQDTYPSPYPDPEQVDIPTPSPSLPPVTVDSSSTTTYKTSSPAKVTEKVTEKSTAKVTEKVTEKSTAKATEAQTLNTEHIHDGTTKRHRRVCRPIQNWV